LTAIIFSLNSLTSKAIFSAFVKADITEIVSAPAAITD